MIPLADVWDYRSKWCKEFADNWERESYDLEGIYSYRLATMKKPARNYYRTYCCSAIKTYLCLLESIHNQNNRKR